MKEPLHDLAYHIGYIIGLQNICGCFNKPAYRVFSTERRQENRKKATFFRFLYITKIQHYFEQKKCLNQIVFLFFVSSTFTMTSFTTSSYKMNPLLFGV